MGGPGLPRRSVRGDAVENYFSDTLTNGGYWIMNCRKQCPSGISSNRVSEVDPWYRRSTPVVIRVDRECFFEEGDNTVDPGDGTVTWQSPDQYSNCGPMRA